jgi:hypothetical protein
MHGYENLGAPSPILFVIRQMKRKFGSLINGCTFVFLTQLNNDFRVPSSFIGMDVLVGFFSSLN